MGYKKEIGVSEITQSEALVSALRRGDWIECEQLCMKIYHEYIWNPCYEKVIEECWNKFHGMYCGLLMVRYVKEDVLQGYIDEFSNLQLTYLVINRFYSRSWIRYDRDRICKVLYESGDLSVMECGAQMCGEDVEDLLYRWIGTLVWECKRVDRPVQNVFNAWNVEMYDVRDGVGVREIVRFMQVLKHWGACENFYKWANRVSRKYQAIVRNDVQENWTNFLGVITDEFPVWLRDYVCGDYFDRLLSEQLNLQEIIQIHPKVGELMDVLKLQPIKEN